MKQRTRCSLELFLYNFAWLGDILCRPSYRHLGESFEGWAYRKGLLTHIRRLEAGKYLECEEKSTTGTKLANRILRLTDQGRRQAMGGRDPEFFWGRSWDGLWRSVAFDLPETQRTARQRLRRLLRRHGFGRIQGSVWISPDPIDPILQELTERGSEPSNLLWNVEASTAERDKRIVQSAWKFETINKRYTAYLEQLQACPLAGSSVDAMGIWLSQEREAWLHAASLDPFLPQELWPEGYLGQEAWAKRRQLMRRFRTRLLNETDAHPKSMREVNSGRPLAGATGI